MVLFTVNRPRLVTLPGMYTLEAEPVNERLEVVVVLNSVFAPVPAIAGPLSISVFAPIVNVPDVSVNVPVMVAVAVDNETPPDVFTISRFPNVPVPVIVSAVPPIILISPLELSPPCD